MNHLEYLTVYRSNLKKWVSEDLGQALEKLQRQINPASELSNDLLQLEGRYNAVEKEVIQGTIETEDRFIAQNRIRADLLRWIDQLSYADILGEDDELFLHFQREHEQRQDLSEASPPAKSAGDHTLADLQIFAEMHGALLSFYPVVFREVRSVIIRNDHNDARIGPLLSVLRQEFALMDSLKKEMEALERKVPKIPREAAERILSTQYKNLKYKLSRVMWDSLPADLRSLQQELQSIL